MTKQDKQNYIALRSMTIEEMKKEIQNLVLVQDNDKHNRAVLRLSNFFDESISTIRREAYLQGAKDAIEAVKLVKETYGTRYDDPNSYEFGYNAALAETYTKAQQFIDSLEKK